MLKMHLNLSRPWHHHNIRYHYLTDRLSRHVRAQCCTEPSPQTSSNSSPATKDLATKDLATKDLVTAFLPAARAGALSTARFAAAHFAHRNASLAQCVESSPNAIHFPCGIAPFGMPSGGNGPSPGGDWMLRWCGMFVAMPMLWNYEYLLQHHLRKSWCQSTGVVFTLNLRRSRYSQNETFGRETLLPMLSGLADYWRCWMERLPIEMADGEEGYVLVDEQDNISEQGWWMGCSRGSGSGCSWWQDPIMSIAFVKRLFATLPILARELSAAEEQWWEEFGDHLPAYNSAEYLLRGTFVHNPIATTCA